MSSLVLEIRDPTEARRFLAQGLWFQRLAGPSAATVGPALVWALELASGGDPVPPVGVVADVGHLVLGEGGTSRGLHAGPEVPGWSAGLARAYEDLVLGKLDADDSVSRASAALARYRGRDRDRGLAFLLDRLRHRAGFGGALINPAVIKAAIEYDAAALLAAGWESLTEGGPLPAILTLYEAVITGVRDMPEALGPEDVFELEHRTALAPFAQRVAVRQLVQAASEFQAGVAPERPRPGGPRPDVATRVFDDDAYPVGGFSSISTRGSIESLLHSQLVYMERDERPDLFDIKFVRDELLYYARDENQFLRRRRCFVIVLHPDLVLARVKDARLPLQRVVLLLALLVAAVRVLTGWLSDEAIVFEFLLLRDADADPLAAERALLGLILREPVANGTVVTESVAAADVPARLVARDRRSLTHALSVATTDRPIVAGVVTASRLVIAGPTPSLELEGEPAPPQVGNDALTAWQDTLDRLLKAWV